MNKKGAVPVGYESVRYGPKEDIRDINDVAIEIRGGRYEAISPIYRKSDDAVMARKGLVLSPDRIKKMKEEISNSLKRKKSSPYFTQQVAEESA
jgi:hypothetical protein